jgi:general secretion pathway protein M
MSFWSNLHKREQLAVLWGGGVLLLLFSYVLVIAPLRADLVLMKKEVVVKKADLIWMQDAAVKARGLKASRTDKPAGSPLQLIDQAARRYGIDSSLKKVDSGEGNKIKVWFEGPVYVDFMHFLRGTGANRGLGINNLTVERLDAPGIVNARVTFEAESK